MTESSPREIEFLTELNASIAANLGREEFGVTELAEVMNMSRSNLLRKVKKATNLSVSQLISQARLQRAMELLRTTSMNVSEVSHEVGFSSASYFIKCFREYYGYPPGEAAKRANESSVPVAPPPVRSNRKIWLTAIAGAVVLIVGVLAFRSWPYSTNTIPEKSIMVLPFKNDSADSTNMYLINGLMDATLNNLQMIKDLRVLSRTSAEKYRDSDKTIPEMAEELNVSYVVEGSGQKIGDRIVLNIQLIDGKGDRHLWGKQYRRETNDIFALQQEISKDIADQIQVVITPDEKTRIEKIPTQDLAAYDLFMKGVDLLKNGEAEAMQQSLVYFDQAIEKDDTFALAYACAGIACYYLDLFKSDKHYVEKLGSYADKALLYDPQLGESLTAKAMYYMQRKDFEQARPFLEKGVEYNPNSSLIIGLLADFYGMYLPNTGKYLEYALRGLRLDVGSGDSLSQSYFYLRLANALIQTGFIDESLRYLDKSLDYKSDNPYSRYLRAFVLYAKERNLRETRELLQLEFRKDTNRFDILQDIGKVSYYMREFDTAYHYYERFDRYRKMQKLDVYTHENMIIGVTYDKVGEHEKAKQFIESYRKYLDTDQTAYRNLGFAMYYSYLNEYSKALEHFKLFTKEDNIQYWVILFLADDPMLDEIKHKPDFKKVLVEIDKKFWNTNERIRKRLEEEGVWQTGD